MTPTPIQTARHRLEALWADTLTEDTRSHRIVIAKEHEAMRTVLDELHRLNEVASVQRKHVDALLAQKRRHWHAAEKPGRKPKVPIPSGGKRHRP
jgi:hypothetical protein